MLKHKWPIGHIDCNILMLGLVGGLTKHEILYQFTKKVNIATIQSHPLGNFWCHFLQFMWHFLSRNILGVRCSQNKHMGLALQCALCSHLFLGMSLLLECYLTLVEFLQWIQQDVGDVREGLFCISVWMGKFMQVFFGDLGQILEFSINSARQGN